MKNFLFGEDSNSRDNGSFNINSGDATSVFQSIKKYLKNDALSERITDATFDRIFLFDALENGIPQLIQQKFSTTLLAIINHVVNKSSNEEFIKSAKEKLSDIGEDDSEDSRLMLTFISFILFKTSYCEIGQALEINEDVKSMVNEKFNEHEELRDKLSAFELNILCAIGSVTPKEAYDYIIRQDDFSEEARREFIEKFKLTEDKDNCIILTTTLGGRNITVVKQDAYIKITKTRALEIIDKHFKDADKGQ